MDNTIPENNVLECSQTEPNTIDETSIDIEKSEKTSNVTEDVLNIEIVNETEHEKKESEDQVNLHVEENNAKRNEKEIYLVDNFHYKMSEGFLENSELFIEIPEIKFCEQIKVEYLCDFCHLVIWRPVKPGCEHTICESCQVPSEENVSCPIDLIPYDITGMYIDDDLQKEVVELKIFCIESECDWKGNVESLEDHFKGCTFKKMECTQCGELVKLIEFEDHVNNLCEFRTLNCQHCSSTMIYKEIENHEENCYHKKVPCPNQCKTETEPKEVKLIKQGNLEEHLNIHCEDRSTPCQFAEFDCKKVTKYRKLGIHLAKHALIHLDSLCKTSKNSRDMLESQILTMIHLREKIKENDKKINILQKRTGPQLLWKIVDVQEKYQAAIKSKSSELFSSYFFSTSPYGYKIIMRVMLNGSSALSSGRYVSVFISLCENPYNNLLKWPFEQKVTVHLINQVTENHTSYTIIPNAIKENYDYLKKPDTERNPFFGIDKFIPCSSIDGDTEYVVNDTMFLKVNIEPGNVV